MSNITKRVIGYIFVATMVCTTIASYVGLLDAWAEADAIGQLPVIGYVAAIWIAVSGIGLWIWMLVDYFHGRQMKHRVLTGVGLFLLSWLAAIVYFISVYVPASKAED